MLTTILFLFYTVIAYLMGSICSAVIVCRLFELPDPRLTGSKNPGATNVLRIAGKQYAAIVLLADMLKGVLPVLFANLLGAGSITVAFTCFAVVVGHAYPIYFGYKGGKGVATAMGALLGFHFLLGVIVIATWLVVANFSRYASLASIVSMILAPFYSLFAVGNANAFLPIFFITILIVYKHRANIGRLMDGDEPKLNFQNKTPLHDLLSENTPAETPVKRKPAKPVKTPNKSPSEKKPTKPKKATSKKQD